MRHLILIGLLSLCSTAVRANEAKNTTTNTDYATLAEAVEDAAPGQSIDLLRDVSMGTLVLNKRVNIDGRGFKLTHVGNGLVEQPAILVTADLVFLTSITINGGLHGVRVVGADDVTIFEVVINKMTVHGVFASELSNIIVSTSSVFQNGAEGIRLRNVTGASLNNLTFENMGGGPLGEGIILETDSNAGTPTTAGVSIGGVIETTAQSLFVLRGDGAIMPNPPVYTPSPGSSLPAAHLFTIGVDDRYRHFIYQATQVDDALAEFLACGPAAPSEVYLYSLIDDEYWVKTALMTPDGTQTHAMEVQAAIDAAPNDATIKIFGGTYPDGFDVGGGSYDFRFAD